MRCYKIPCPYTRIDEHMLAEIAAQLQGNTVIIYGAGNIGGRVSEALVYNGIEVLCFCDASPEKQGKIFCGKPVIAPIELREYPDVYVVIGVYHHHAEICENLNEIGVSHTRIRIPLYTTETHTLHLPCDAPTGAVLDCEKLKAEEWVLPGKMVAAYAPKVLIYTRAYNVPAYYLRRAIESVLRQTYADFAYLIIDNGSTGETHELINAYARKDRRITVVRYETNSNTFTTAEMITARNKLWDDYYSKYQYICSLDTDDYYEPAFLEKTLALAQQYDADIVVGNCITYEESNPASYWIRWFPIGNRAIENDAHKADVFRDFYAHHSSIWGRVYTRAAYKYYKENILALREATFSKEYRNISDFWACYAYFFHSSKIVMTDEILHCCTKRKHSITTDLSVDDRYMERFVALHNYTKDIIEKFGYCVADYQEALDWLLYGVALGTEIDYIEGLAQDNGAVVAKIIEAVLGGDVFATVPMDPRAQSAIERLKKLQAKIKSKEAVLS